MDSRRYGLITGFCFWVLIICAFTVDKVPGQYKVLVHIIVGSVGLISLVTYFYNQHLLNKRNKDGVKMPKYVISTLPESDVNKVADLMRKAGANIIGVSAIPNSKRTSGRIILECPAELAERLQKIDGVKYFEEKILYHLVSR